MIKRYIEPDTIGKRRLNKLTLAEVQAWINRLSTQVAPLTVRNAHARLRKALAVAGQRGVEVQLLIGVGEIWLQDMVARSFYPKLLEAGVKVVEYRKTQLHAKVAVIDDDWATVGSSNVDGLSLFLNQEANVVIKDAEFTRSLRAKIEDAIADGVVIHPQDFEHVGRFRRVGYEVAYFFYRTLMRIFAVGKYT